MRTSNGSKREAKTTQQIVRSKYPDANAILSGSGDQYLIVSREWFPGAIGHGWTKAQAWTEAARVVSTAKESHLISPS